MSRNAVTISQLKLACCHVDELTAAGVTENLAIRTLELFADVYAKIYTGGSATPHHVDQVHFKQWSVEARKLKKSKPNLKPKNYLRVEHGTPRRSFAREVIKLHRKRKLNRTTMNQLVDRYWKLAVITLKEDRRLNRSKMFDKPENRWKAAGIKF